MERDFKKDMKMGTWRSNSDHSGSSNANTHTNEPHHVHAEDPYASGHDHVGHREFSRKVDMLTHGEHGPPIDNLDAQQELAREEYEEHQDLLWSRIRNYIRDPAAECLATMIMIIFGDGSVAQVVLSANKNLPAGAQNKGEYQSISWGWGIGVMMAVYVGGCSGAHLNPAVTLVNCIFRGFPWKKFPVYMVAQTLGCFLGAAIIYGNYKSAIDAYEGGASIRTVPGYSDTATAGVFCTYPAPFLSRVGMFFDEFLATAVLILVIFALKDDANLGAGNLIPIALFFLIFGIGATLGWQTGYAINFARDFGPRLLTYAVGYGPNVWRAGGYYFWIPMVAPFLGGTFGGFLYDLIIFQGESPINTPWFGFKRMLFPRRDARDSSWNSRKAGGNRRGDLEAANGHRRFFAGNGSKEKV